MVQCEKCRETSEKPKQRFDLDEGDYYPVCGLCGSEIIRISEDSCSACGRALYPGDLAYETENALFCGSCIREVMV